MPTPISFACPKCGRPMKVPANAAGKRGKCKDCGESVVVPSPKTMLIAAVDTGTTAVKSIAGHTLKAASTMLAVTGKLQTAFRRKPSETTVIISASQQETPKPNMTVSSPVVKPDDFRSYAPGIASIVFGILGLATTWIPFIGIIGLPFCLAGILFAVFAIGSSVFRKFRGFECGLLGAAMSIGAAISCYFSYHTTAKSLIFSLFH